MNKLKEMWEDIKTRLNQIEVKTKDGVVGVVYLELKHLLDEEEISAIDMLIDDFDLLEEKYKEVPAEFIDGYFAEEVNITSNGTIYTINMEDYPEETVAVGDLITVNGKRGVVTTLETRKDLLGESGYKISVTISNMLN